MKEKIIPPSFNANKFHCPHCGILALQRWFDAHRNDLHSSGHVNTGFRLALCDHCNKYSMWINNKMIFPDSISVPEPNEDLNEGVKQDYLEAAIILEKSPRGAAALLRLALQKLCIQLGESGDLNKDIKHLVSRGLSVRIQQALDILRVIGNNAVHPGKIDVKDDKNTSLALFELINLISDSMVSEPKRVEELYGKLPEESRKQIEERDKPRE